MGPLSPSSGFYTQPALILGPESWWQAFAVREWLLSHSMTVREKLAAGTTSEKHELRSPWFKYQSDVFVVMYMYT